MDGVQCVCCAVGKFSYDPHKEPSVSEFAHGGLFFVLQKAQVYHGKLSVLHWHVNEQQKTAGNRPAHLFPV